MQRARTSTASDTGMVSPLVDIVFNLMATMFVFLMIYMLIAIPTRTVPIQFADLQLPPATVGVPYTSSVPVFGGVGPYAFGIGDTQAPQALFQGPDRSFSTPPASCEGALQELVVPATTVATPADGTVVRLDGHSGLVEAVFSSRPAAGRVALPVLVSDTGARVSCDAVEPGKAPPTRVFRIGEDGQCALSHCITAIGRRIDVAVSPSSVPFDADDHPLTLTAETPVLETIEGLPIQIAMVATGGIEPYEFRRGADLPAWATIDPATGRLSARAVPSGTHTLTVELKDAQTQSGDWDLAAQSPGGVGFDRLRLTVTARPYLPPAPRIVLPAFGRVGEPISGSVHVDGGYGDLRYEAISLPPGVTLDPGGRITGTVPRSGQFDVVVAVSDDHPSGQGTDVRTEIPGGWQVLPPRPAPSVGRGG